MSSTCDREPNRKIVGADLQEFVVSDLAERLPILVEINLPRPMARGEQRQRAGRLVYEPVEIAKQAPKKSDVIEQISKNLEQILGDTPVWIGAAHAFAVFANPSQVRGIAELIDVVSVRPSRKRRLNDLC